MTAPLPAPPSAATANALVAAGWRKRCMAERRASWFGCVVENLHTPDEDKRSCILFVYFFVVSSPGVHKFSTMEKTYARNREQKYRHGRFMSSKLYTSLYISQHFRLRTKLSPLITFPSRLRLLDDEAYSKSVFVDEPAFHHLLRRHTPVDTDGEVLRRLGPFQSKSHRAR